MTAIVFDLDDTLYPERTYNFSGFAAVDAYLLRTHGIEGFGALCRELFDDGIRGTIFDLAIARLGLVVAADELVQVYRDHDPTIEPFPDAAWVLPRLKERHPLGLITDGFAQVQRRKVRALGMESMFDCLIYSDDHGRSAWKPSPVPYALIEEALGARASSFIYIGDNPRKDFVTARARGWRTVMIERPTSVHRSLDVTSEFQAEYSAPSLWHMPWQALGIQPVAPPESLHSRGVHNVPHTKSHP